MANDLSSMVNDNRDMVYDVERIRKDFPILSREVNGHPLVYLDTGASAQKPQVVIDAVSRAYSEEYANVHRGLHFLSNLATDKYENVRGIIRDFLGAPNDHEILFTTGTTEAINLVSYAWAARVMSAGDEILLSVLEHHANIVPWNFLRERLGVTLKWIEPDSCGELRPQRVLDAVGPRTRLIAVTHMSNVLGTQVDVGAICTGAAGLGIPVLVDGSQAAVHMPVNVREIGCDFYAVTGHKLYGPSASGALYVREERLDEMWPFKGGGDMIREVRRDGITYNVPPHKFEAGTPGIVQMIGLGAALEYLQSLGMETIARHEADIRDYALERLAELAWLKLQGNAPDRGAIFSFTIDGAGHPHDISTVVDQKGIAVRAGHHCAQPLMEHLGVTATCRASCGLYTTRDDIDRLIEALELCHELLAA